MGREVASNVCSLLLGCTKQRSAAASWPCRQGAVERRPGQEDEAEEGQGNRWRAVAPGRARNTCMARARRHPPPHPHSGSARTSSARRSSSSLPSRKTNEVTMTWLAPASSHSRALSVVTPPPS